MPLTTGEETPSVRRVLLYSQIRGSPVRGRTIISPLSAPVTLILARYASNISRYSGTISSRMESSEFGRFVSKDSRGRRIHREQLSVQIVRAHQILAVFDEIAVPILARPQGFFHRLALADVA